MNPDDVRYFMDQPKPKTKEEICDTHGPYQAINVSPVGIAWSRCPACEVFRDEERERHREARRREELAQAFVKDRAKLDETGIPRRFQASELLGYSADSEEQRAALDFATDYANTFDLALQSGRSAVFVGNTGTGKTHLATGIALHVHRKGCSVRYATVQQAVNRVKHSWRKDGEVEAQVIKDYSECDLLILDEVGVQFGSEFERNLLFGILNDRYNNQRPVILISNLTVEMVTAFLGERVIDRLREDGGRIVPFAWTSHRREP